MRSRNNCPGLCLAILALLFAVPDCSGLDVIFAINAGGEEHVDTHGIRYAKDPLTVGITSDFGKQLLIGRVPTGDRILYQTERYHHSTFGYEIPISEDGDYVMILKFCEVYFNAPNMKVRFEKNYLLNLLIYLSFHLFTMFLKNLLPYRIPFIYPGETADVTT